MTTDGEPPRTGIGFDADRAAAHLWHELWRTIEDDVPTFAVGPYPSYEKVKAFEARIGDELRRAYAAGAESRPA